jgi:glutamate N-acetyltransferase/amino-acid N-acetyltransferase
MPSECCPGYRTAGVVAGLKKNGERDLGLILSEGPAAVAGVFTRNRVQAAPVRLSRERLARGVCRAVVVNSGNANCCTGDGMDDARRMTRAIARQLSISEKDVLVASTGVIGEKLPIDAIERAAPELVRRLRPNEILPLASAMMTTDTVPKFVTRSVQVGDRRLTLTGVAKGAGMIRPDMATMLCFLMTDAAGRDEALAAALKPCCDRTFNRITVDGDTSTNDTVLLLANGYSGISLADGQSAAAFASLLEEVMRTLAKALIRDAEGGTKLIEVEVTGARSESDALRVAVAVAHSPLVKTALFGEDANWGRILAAAGRAGAELDPEKIEVCFDDVQIVKNGMGCGTEAESRASAVMTGDEYVIRLDLGLGSARAAMITCDFSLDYVKINADYRS